MKTRLTGQPLTGLVPLPEAAFVLRRGWKWTLNAILRGDLDAERRIVGPRGGARWYVRTTSLKRLAQRLRQQK